MNLKSFKQNLQCALNSKAPNAQKKIQHESKRATVSSNRTSIQSFKHTKTKIE